MATDLHGEGYIPQGPRRAAAVLLAGAALLGACSRGPAPLPAQRVVSPAAPQPSPSPDVFELARRLQAPSPQELARRLARAEAAIRSPGTAPGELPELGRLQQAAYRQLLDRPEWVGPVLAGLPDGIRPPALANLEAGRELRALARPRDSLPAWRIVPPPALGELLGAYREAQAAYGVRWEYLAAIHLVESRMGRIRGVSAAGARGPMQFLPSTWARYGQGDIENPRDAILAAARYLTAHGAPADMDRALFGYNPSPHYVRGVRLYAKQMMADERAYLGYYHWEVYVRTTRGDALLPVGYGG